MTVPSHLLVLRADADSHTGAGHVMRCLALAQKWRSQGGEAIFAGHINAEPLRHRLESEGFQIVDINSPPHPSRQDLLSFVPWLRERHQQAGWIALDGYHFDAAYHQTLRATGWPLLILDDYAHLPAYHAEILVNPNVYGDEIHYQTEEQTLLLRGARFVLLRDEFRQPTAPNGSAPNHDRSRPSRNIMVTFGGADPDNVTQKVIEALQSMDNYDLEVKIIVGPLNPHRQSLETQLRQTSLNAAILPQVTDMAPLMRWADLAISAAGSTCWELAALGVPMVVTILADNQELLAASLAERGAAINLGWHHTWQTEATGQVILNLLDDSQKRQMMKEKGQLLIDGRGCERLIRAMRGWPFTLRSATADDCEIVFQWANDPLTRTASFSQGSISWQEHCRWFAARLADHDHIFYIALTPQGTPMAQARFTLNTNNEALISVSLAHEFRGAGLGSRLIKMACKKLSAERPVTRIRALIKQGNTSSQHTFAQAGFRKQETIEISGQPVIAMDSIESIAA